MDVPVAVTAIAVTAIAAIVARGNGDRAQAAVYRVGHVAVFLHTMVSLMDRDPQSLALGWGAHVRGHEWWQSWQAGPGILGAR